MSTASSFSTKSVSGRPSLLRSIADLLALETHADRTERLRLGRLARGWFSSSGRHPGSFRWICQFLDLDSKRLRSRIFEIADNDSVFFEIANSCNWRSQLKAILAGEIEQGSEVAPVSDVDRCSEAFGLAADSSHPGKQAFNPPPVIPREDPPYEKIGAGEVHLVST